MKPVLSFRLHLTFPFQERVELQLGQRRDEVVVHVALDPVRRGGRVRVTERGQQRRKTGDVTLFIPFPRHGHHGMHLQRILTSL